MRDDTFTAATWNMGGGETDGGPTPAAAAEVLAELEGLGAGIVLGQETQDRADRDALEALGYTVDRAAPESLVAWKAPAWTCVFSEDVKLNPTTPYFRPGKKTPVFVVAAHVILCNPVGLSVECLSYHTPSSVQPADDAPDRRLAALRECMDTLAELADESRADAFLAGGDDNVDERTGSWPFMLEPATGLRQVVAPGATLGARRVDDFRVQGLIVKRGRVVAGPTHGHGGHNAHVRKFRFRK